MIQDAPITHADTATIIASSLTTLAVVAQGVYARHKGRKRDPLLSKLQDRVEALEAKIETLIGLVGHKK